MNLIMGWWSMYPPFFATGDHPIPEKRAFDKYSFRLLTELARTGPGNIIGFHPEGTRNKSDDPYSYLRAQPGIGKLIMDAQPQVIPVFIAGLCNSLPRQVARNWNRKEVIRIHFGPVLDLTEYSRRSPIDCARTKRLLTPSWKRSPSSASRIGRLELPIARLPIPRTSLKAELGNLRIMSLSYRNR